MRFLSWLHVSRSKWVGVEGRYYTILQVMTNDAMRMRGHQQLHNGVTGRSLRDVPAEILEQPGRWRRHVSARELLRGAGQGRATVLRPRPPNRSRDVGMEEVSDTLRQLAANAHVARGARGYAPVQKVEAAPRGLVQGQGEFGAAG